MTAKPSYAFKHQRFKKNAKDKCVSALHAISLKKEGIILVKLPCITQQKEWSVCKKPPSVAHCRTQAGRDV